MSGPSAPPVPARAVWHDVECGSYDADLALWEALAREAPGPVLDVGAGTGRVALRLARAGHEVTALDHDGLLLAVLAERAAREGLPVEVVEADAARFDLAGRGFGLVALPMQTLQLLPGAQARAGLWTSARRALAPGGRVAAAITGELEAFDAAGPLPAPDVGEAGGWRFLSQPVALVPEEEAVRIERLRTLVAPEGTRTVEADAVRLHRVTPGGLAEEAAAHGLEAEELRHVPETDLHVAAVLVILRG